MPHERPYHTDVLLGSIPARKLVDDLDIMIGFGSGRLPSGSCSVIDGRAISVLPPFSTMTVTRVDEWRFCKRSVRDRCPVLREVHPALTSNHCACEVAAIYDETIDEKGYDFIVCA